MKFIEMQNLLITTDCWRNQVKSYIFNHPYAGSQRDVHFQKLDILITSFRNFFLPKKFLSPSPQSSESKFCKNIGVCRTCTEAAKSVNTWSHSWWSPCKLMRTLCSSNLSCLEPTLPELISHGGDGDGNVEMEMEMWRWKCGDGDGKTL